MFTKHGVRISFKSEPTEHNTALEEGNLAKEHLTTELAQAMPNSETESPYSVLHQRAKHVVKDMAINVCRRIMLFLNP